MGDWGAPTSLPRIDTRRGRLASREPQGRGRVKLEQFRVHLGPIHQMEGGGFTAKGLIVRCANTILGIVGECAG